MNGEGPDSGLNLAKVLWYYQIIPNRSTGGTHKIVCPFHQDINPSMLVDFEKGHWFCFGCNCSGDARRFVEMYEKEHNGLNSLCSYKRYSSILKSDKCSNVKIAKNDPLSRPSSEETMDESWNYFYGLRKVNWKEPELPEEVEAKEYMAKRGFGPRSLIGSNAKVTFNRQYGLIFPMLDNGEFKGWVCRTMVREVEERRKYLYNRGFSRATTLVGDYGKEDYVFVVEGYMDWLRFREQGIKNVVALLGWKASPDQIKKLKDKGIKKIISALDNDECGKKGTAYLKQFFNVMRFSYLRGVKDPGEMNSENFRKMLSKTMKEFRRNM